MSESKRERERERRQHSNFVSFFSFIHSAYLYWLYNVNRGIFLPPGLDDQWTVSAMHSEADINYHIRIFEQFCQLVRNVPATATSASIGQSGQSPRIDMRSSGSKKSSHQPPPQAQLSAKL
jgi:hypothetical protein